MNKKILIVDVDPAVHCQIINIANCFSVDVYSVFCPLAALQSFRRQAYDLVITELMLPNINGLDFVRRVRGMHHHVPVVFLSTHLISLTHDQRADYNVLDVFYKNKVKNSDLLHIMGLDLSC